MKCVLPENRLINFLRNELAIPVSSLELAIRIHQTVNDSLPIVLWQYGLIDLSQLARVLDWLSEPLTVELT